MNHALNLLLAGIGTTVCTVAPAADVSSKASAKTAVPYGHAGFYPSPERPAGWLGDGSGLFLGTGPPLDVNE